MVHPYGVFHIPVDGFGQAFLELQRRLPAQFFFQLGAVDGVTLIVPGAVFNERNQFFRAAFRTTQLFVHRIAEVRH